MKVVVPTAELSNLDNLADQFGGKSFGFVAIPSAWRPPALLVGYELFVAHRAGGDAFDNLSEIVWRQLQTFGRSCGPDLIVRSSATNETIKERGRYQSVEVAADITLGEFRQVLNRIFEDFVNSGAKGDMCLIVQRYVTGAETGFLSNEHRLVDKPYRWIVERSLVRGSDHSEPASISAKQATVVATDEPLVCLTRQEMLSRLRSVARYFWKASSQRLLIEWCWDGTKLWILQRDVDLLSSEGRTPDSIIGSFPPPPTIETGTVFHRYDVGTSTPWSKLNNVADFMTGKGTPPHRLFFAPADRVASALKTPQERKALAEEIDFLTAGRAVLRTDSLRPSPNLSRTNTVNGKAAVQWLRGQTAAWYMSGVALTDVAFILHSYIPARAAAWSHYERGSAIVRIDGLWGLADGMQYYPTDTYLCQATDGKLLSEMIRFKELVLLEQLNGTWITDAMAPIFGRYRALTKAERTDIAIRTKKIADNIASDVQIMWFVGVPNSYKLEPNLPWYKETPEQPLEERKSKPLPSIKIRTAEDLSQLGDVRPGSRKIVLEPRGEDLRSNQFIKDVSAAAVRLNIPIEIRGSVLSHAFHQLRKAGAQVYSAEPGRLPDELRQKRAFNKLVRDEIPGNIEAKGEAVSADEIAHEELRVALVGKLFEESEELLSAETSDETTEELADIFEILRALADASGVGLDAVIKKADTKRIKRGGFGRGLILRSTSAVGPPESEPVLFAEGTGRRRINLSSLRNPAPLRRRAELLAAALLSTGPQVVRLLFPGNVVVSVKVQLAGGEIVLTAVDVIDPSGEAQTEML